MLAVTTFSLTAMVTLQRSAARMFTPRVHLVLMKDRTTQNALATFIGAWIYALLATVILDLPYFGERGRVALFVTTVLLLSLIVMSTLRWILHLQSAGSLIDTARRIEDEAAGPLAAGPGARRLSTQQEKAQLARAAAWLRE
ncbi:putative membrane protein [Rubellimicrobium thermophilum DSM 16684]|uniref:Putative membrane protein n=2 Tax=Rubellimicrobium TaxID=295418 RepID=S9R2L3_9RHOB|nr:putative membrane protein [Rubellimicrobium thermophilum DSM 16684]